MHQTLQRRSKELGKLRRNPPGRGGTLGISDWGCAAGTLEPSTYTRANSAEFCYPILLYYPSYPRVAVFHKLVRSLAQSSQNKTL